MRLSGTFHLARATGTSGVAITRIHVLAMTRNANNSDSALGIAYNIESDTSESAYPGIVGKYVTLTYNGTSYFAIKLVATTSSDLWGSNAQHCNFVGVGNNIDFFALNSSSHTITSVSELNNREGTKTFFNSRIGIDNHNPQYKFDVYSGDDVTMRLHRNNSGLTRNDTCGLGFSQRGDNNTSSSDTRAGIFSTYNGNLFLATERAGNLNSNPEDHCRLYVSGYGGISIAKVSAANSKLPHTKTTEADIQFAGRYIWKRIESSTYLTTTASNHFKIAFYRNSGTDNGASFTTCYYRGVTVIVNAGGKRDWSNHGYVTHYSKTLLTISGTTTGRHHHLINKGFSYINNNENNMKLSTVTWSYDSNYLYATFKFITNESGDGWDPYYNVEVDCTDDIVYNVQGI